MRRGTRAAVAGIAGLALVVLAGCAGVGGGASASCAAPRISVTSGDLTPGGLLDFTAEPFTDGCHDGGTGVDHAATGLSVELEVGDRTVNLGTVDAVDDGFRATGHVRLPADLPTGAGTLTVGGGSAANGDAETSVTVAEG